jgi:transposase
MSTNNEQLQQAMDLLLELPQTRVEAAFEDRDGQLIITLSSTQEGTTCHRCGKWITTRNGFSEWITLRHLDLLGKPVYLRFRLPRYRCDCSNGPTTTQQVSWFTRRSSMTKAYEEHLLRACINSTLSDVAYKEGVSVETLQGLLDRQIATTPAWENMTSLEVIGIDEIALKKGHRDFVAIVTGQTGDQRHIIGVLKDRKKATVVAFLSSIPKRLRRTVRVFCSDLYEGFIGAAKAVFGRHVRVVADRFHVAKLYRQAVDDLRKKELKRLKRTLSTKEYQSLKGAMWALRKQPKDLSEEEQAVLARLFQWSPDLRDAVAYRDELTALFDRDDLTPKQAKLLFNGWAARVKRSGLRCFDTFIKTLNLRKDEISNYFLARHNSGFVEGLNNKIKVIKRRCYGLLNREHLFQRLYLDLFGYSLYERKIKGLHSTSG